MYQPLLYFIFGMADALLTVTFAKKKIVGA